MTLRSYTPCTHAFFVAITLLGALLLTMPSGVWAKQDMAKEDLEKGKQFSPMAPEQMEKRIVHLHDVLQITQAQEAAWKDFAQVMRDNTTKMNGLMEKWSQGRGKRNALENLKAHGEMAEEHAQAIRKLIPAFETLYNSMSVEQKKGADEVFDHEKWHMHHKGKKS